VLLRCHCVQAVVGGTASSGVIICCLRVITKAALPPTRAGLRSSTALYFALSGLLSLACFVVYHSVLPKLGVVQYFKQKRAEGECRQHRVQGWVHAELDRGWVHAYLGLCIRHAH
jgi:hypothetical protein